MNWIDVECPACRRFKPVPASCLLLEVGSEPADAGDDLSAAWICEICHQLVTLPVELTVFIGLVATGAQLLDSVADDPRPAHPETAVGGRLFTPDDLLDFHEHLANDVRLSDLT